MATILNKVNRLTEAQQKEIVTRCNEAYDRGGADALKLIKETAEQIGKDFSGYCEHAAFTLYIVEAVRQRLMEAVDNQVHDKIPEVPKVTIN
jgi:hypothetical protein